MKSILCSIEKEWRRYKDLGERALEQTHDNELGKSGASHNNSIAVIVRHIAGNLKSRFTDFLTSDGEKPWRDRDSEFQTRPDVTRQELLQIWNEGWETLFAALEPLNDEDLARTVTIRGEKLLVHEALHRLLAHTSYHVGQIVYLAKLWRGTEWHWLTIPPGASQEYKPNPPYEK